LNGTIEEFIEDCDIFPRLFPSKTHQALLCNTDGHVVTKVGTHTDHSVSRDAMNVDNSECFSAVDDVEEIFNGVTLP